MATPALAMSTIERVWSVVPTSAQIMANVARWPPAIAAIVDNQGMPVQKAEGGGQRKQRACLPTLHPDAHAALAVAEARFSGAGN